MSSAGQSFQRSLQGGAGALVVPVGKGGFYADPAKTVKIMADLQADLLITTPPYALLLAEIAESPDPPLRPTPLRLGTDVRLRFMWLTGEGCSPAYRKRLEETWHCPGLVFYGSLECGPIGLECRQQAGCHICAGHVYLEVVDPRTGEPLPAGQVGEVVCTVLQRRASPLLRFRTQDLAVLDPSPCPCGVSLPRLHIRGRVVDQVRAGEPSAAAAAPSVSPYQIEQVLYSQPEMGGNYQIYTAGDRLVVDVELRSGRGERGPVLERIRDQLARFGLGAEVHAVDHIPRTAGKTRRVRPLTERAQVMAAPSLLRRTSS